MSYGIDLQAQADKILSKYGKDVEKTLAEVIEETAKEATKTLKKTSPRKTGKYASGWTYEIEKGRVVNSATIYGKRQTYPLAHLLENGHAKRGGGRVPGIPHIKPVEEWAISEVEKKVGQKVSEL